MFTKVKKFVKNIYNEMEVSNDMQKIYVQSFAILFFVFLSIFWKWFNVITLILAIISIIFNSNGKCVYFLFLLLPFVSIFKINTSDFYLLPIVVATIVLILGVKLIIKLIHKHKLNWPLTIILGIFTLYLFIGLRFSNLTTFLSLMLGLTLLYVLYYFKEHITLKELVFIFSLGMFVSIFIGMFRPISPRLQIMITQYHALELTRFSACAENVNVFSGELSILLAAFTGLYMKKQIRYSYFIVYFISFYVLTFTMSKSALLIFLFITIMLIIYSIVDKRKECWKDILIFLICCLLAFILNPIRNYLYISRLLNNDITSSSGVSNLTTGRLDIWKVYCTYIFKDLKSMMFGYGISAEPIGMFLSMENCNSHNTIIQMWYHIGLLGIILFMLLLVTYIGWRKIFKLNFSIIVTILSVGMFLMGLDFFSYRLSNYIILIFYTYQLNDKRTIYTNKVIEKGGIKNENNCNNNANI